MEHKKSVRNMSALFAFTYMISYMTRLNFGSVISEMVRDTGYTRAALAAAITCSSVTYGFGQLISGFCGDRLRPKFLCLCGLITTGIVNILIPLCGSTVIMTILWGVNGLAQAFMWPPIVKLMTELMTEEEYKHATVVVSWGSSVGTIIMYLIAPVFITFMNWKSIFWVCGLMGIGAAILWNRKCIDVPVSHIAGDDAKKMSEDGFSALLLFVMIAIVFQGMLRDGVTTWMPSLVADIYHMSNSVSILTGVALPLFGIICFRAAERLYQFSPDNPVKCAGIVFGLGTISAVILYVTSGRNAALTVFCAALLTGCMHGVNLLLICMVPPYYKKRGGVATISGLLNSCTYIGSSVSTYGIAAVADRFGWQTTVFAWIIIAAVGCIICFACVRPWKKFVNNEKMEYNE